MEIVKRNGEKVGYAEEPRLVKDFLPTGAPSNIKMLGGTDRELTYGTDIYTVEKTNKQIGQYEGDICPVCKMGEMQNMAGCFTCSDCGVQLKCGL